MAKGFNIRAWLGLDTKQFTKGLKGAQGGMSKFQKGLRGTNDILRGLKFAAVGVTAAGAFSRAVTTIKDFETNMARVKVISQATDGEMKQLTATAREIGATTRFSASEAAQGLQFLTMAGLDASDAMEALKPSLDLAAAGAIEVGEAADMATNLMGGFGKGTEDLAAIVDLMAHTSRTANTNVTELYEAMKESAPLATNLGIEMEEVATAMALMANRGVKAQRAGVALSGTLQRMLRSPKQVAETFQEMGVEITEATLREDGFLKTMVKLNKAGISAEQMAKAFGLHVKTIGVFAGITSDEIDTMSEKIGNFDGAAKKMAEEGIGSIDESIKLFMSALDELFISLGESGISGAITTIIDKARDLVKWFTELSSGSKIFQVGIIAALFNLGKLNTALRIASISLKRYGIATVAASAKTRVLGFAMKSALGPIGLVLIAFEALLLASDNFADSSSEIFLDFNENINSANSELERMNDTLDELSETELQDRISDINKQIEQTGFHIDKIQDKSPMNPDWLLWNNRLKSANEELIKYQETLEKIKKTPPKGGTGGDGGDGGDGDDKENAAKAEAKILSGLKSQNKEMDLLIGKSKTYASTWIDFSGVGGNIDSSGFQEQIGYMRELTKLGGLDIATAEIDTSTLDYYDKVADGARNALEAQIAMNEAIADGATAAFESFGSSAIESFGLAADGAEGFLGGMLEVVNQIISAMLGQAIASAIAGSASSAAGTGPAAIFTQPAFMATMVGGVLAAFASIPKFATGGIMGGNSFSGDKVPAMLNSGEMILNKAQQGNLFAMANGNGSSGGGQVNFEIRGDKLVGVLGNYNKKQGLR